MNGRQAAREAAKHIEQLNDFNRRASADIKAYNQVIEAMRAGKSPCPWCDDYDSCEKAEKDTLAACDEWMLTWKIQEGVNADAENRTDTEAVPDGGCEGGEGTPNIEGAAGTL